MLDGIRCTLRLKMVASRSPKSVTRTRIRRRAGTSASRFLVVPTEHNPNLFVQVIGWGEADPSCSGECEQLAVVSEYGSACEVLAAL